MISFAYYGFYDKCSGFLDRKLKSDETNGKQDKIETIFPGSDKERSLYIASSITLLLAVCIVTIFRVTVWELVFVCNVMNRNGWPSISLAMPC